MISIRLPFALAPFAAFALLGATVPATPAQPAPAAPSAELSAAANRVRSHVEFLSDDLLEGRGSGARGHEIAARYVAAQFRALGLQPGGTGGDWLQRVPLRRASHDGTPVVSLTTGGKITRLAWGSDVSLRPSLTEKQRKLSSQLVFAGYGLSDPALGTDDFRGLNVAGKTVVVLEGTPPGMDTEVAAHLSSVKAQMAAKAGAIGLIEIGRTGDSSRLRQYGRGSATDWVDANGEAGSTPKGLRFRMAMSSTAAAQLFAGASRTLEQVRTEASRGGRSPAGFALPATIGVEANSRWEDFTSPEVVGLLPGTDPRLKAEYVVLMGHLDHLGIKKDAKPGEDAIYNGALDNGAGVATMLEAAREFVASGKPPRRSVLFIANTGEELGLLGADYWAAHPTVPLAQVAAAVDLDMPLPLYPFTDVVAFGAPHNTVARTVTAAAGSMGVKVSPDPMPEQSIFVRSDHYTLAKRGVPAILLMTGFGGRGKDVWANFFAERYHSVRDDLSQAIEWDQLARYAELNYRISRDLADTDQRPRWYGDSYFGKAFAPGQPKAAR
ncbi:M20/M25/M40 family metallo-hydrolase [Sphingomonas sp. KRR8]|uniref:M20/M25/M40 family metallo-hydrolase n=1 Tax=Sphingomonas sp. KRR8 TaxID=2942996 RepID=UPI002021461E|nr:M20/M25/M40 family metallo-hydrolase [Sphingomonas sp. KRR8]URD60398.1 M20/M25/M40 family metallo-hydrolase [Sphingomonas sp. KRR8]